MIIDDMDDGKEKFVEVLMFGGEVYLCTAGKMLDFPLPCFITRGQTVPWCHGAMGWLGPQFVESGKIWKLAVRWVERRDRHISSYI